MTLSIGTKNAHYEIISPIGKGGMGEVYRATDTKLGRDVAIKVLPEEFARDADRVARFQREAKVLASLNHPNIAAIYGLEESDGTNFLVIELVEGNTLDERIKSGFIPVEETLKLALQIAEALEAAHEKGVIHRDLKPANIKVTPDGKVKVLDFGLAKAFSGEQAELNLSNSPTLSQAATLQGVILGTAAYMSPEQARGKPVDKRTDVWAFGCVLYEMLAGRPTWTGDTVTDIIAAAVAKDPDFSILPTGINPAIPLLLTQCLQKDSMERVRDVGDIRIQLKQILADPVGAFINSSPAAGTGKRLPVFAAWIAAAIAITAIIVGLAVWHLKPSESSQVVRFKYNLSEKANLSMSFFAISPDGKMLAWGTNKGIYLKPVDEWDARRITGTDGNVGTTFFSPDGKSIGYWSMSDQKLKKISINGGAPVTLCDVQMVAGADWYADDAIVYGDATSGIMKISAQGGDPECIVKRDKFPILFPEVLPGGDSIVYSMGSGSDESIIMVHSLKSKETKDLLPGTYARYLPSGHLVYWLNDDLCAVPFDPEKLEVTGDAKSVINGVFTIFAPLYAVSNSGALTYVPSSGIITPVWVDKSGNEESLGTELDGVSFPKISPDGTRVAFKRGGTMNSDIVIWDLSRRNLDRLIFQAASSAPLWTIDGEKVVYNTVNNTFYMKSADGTGEPEAIISLPGAFPLLWSWGKDGKTLVLEDYRKKDIGMVSMADDAKWIPLLNNEKYREGQPQVSPDGQWIAYTSDESGRSEVYVRPFPDVDKGRQQVSVSGGNSPLWSRDGRNLYYRNDDWVMSVAVEIHTEFKFDAPTRLFQVPYFNSDTALGSLWDISPDGNRFLMLKNSSPESGTQPEIKIILNWFEELKELVPVE